MGGKKVLDSKTIRFQIIMAMLGAMVTGMQMLQPLLTEKQFAIASLILVVLNTGGSTYLRLITKEPIV